VPSPSPDLPTPKPTTPKRRDKSQPNPSRRAKHRRKRPNVVRRAISGVIWTDTSRQLEDRAAVARELVAVLLSRPQPSVDAPAALATRSAKPPKQEPLSYKALRAQIRPQGPAAPQPVADANAAVALEAAAAGAGRRGAFPGQRKRKLAPPARTLAQVRGEQHHPEPSVSANQRRSQDGGRRQAHSAKVDKLIKKLVKRHGPPTRNEVIDRVRLIIWEIDLDGEAAVFCRMSGREANQGDTANGQAAPNLRLAREEGIGVRYLVLTLNNSGDRKGVDRIDLRLCEQWIGEGWLTKVFWRGPDRMFRRRSTAENHLELLEEEGVELWLAELGRPIDWGSDADDVYLASTGITSKIERRNIYRRTHARIVSRFLAEGRGWPNATFYGTRRDKNMFLEVAPRQWKVVHLIFRRFVELAAEGSGGLRQLRKELAALGEELSENHLRSILTNPIYVDGHWTTVYQEVRYRNRRLRKLGKGDKRQPIPADLFQQANELLAVRSGPNSQTPEGTWLLNCVPFVHAACHGQTKQMGRNQMPARLRARNYPPERNVLPRYTHRPWVPAGCQRYSLDPYEVESAVIGKLLELADEPELPAEWVAAQRPDVDALPAREAKNDAKVLREKLAKLNARLKTQEDKWAQAVAAGQDVDEGAFERMTKALDREIERLSAQLNAAAVPARPAAEPCPPADLEALRRRLHEVLTLGVPDDEVARVRRAALFVSAVSMVMAHDQPDGSVVLEIFGPFAPKGTKATVEQHGVLAAVAAQQQADTRGRCRTNRYKRRAQIVAGQAKLAAQRAQAAEQATATQAASVNGGSRARARVSARDVEEAGGAGQADLDADGPEAEADLVAMLAPSAPWVGVDYARLRAMTSEAGRELVAEEEAAVGRGESHSVSEEDSYRTLCDRPETWSRSPKPASTRPTPASLDLERPLPGPEWFPAWAAQVRVSRMPSMWGKHGGRPRFWTRERVVSRLAEGLLTHPQLVPLTATRCQQFDRAAATPWYATILAAARADGCDVRDLLAQATDRYYQLRSEGPATPAELAANRAFLEGHKPASAPRWTSFEQVMEATVAALAQDPRLFPLRAGSTMRVLSKSGTGPGVNVFYAFCRGAGREPAEVMGACEQLALTRMSDKQRALAEQRLRAPRRGPGRLPKPSPAVERAAAGRRVPAMPAAPTARRDGVERDV
jgi:hypothetical protein